LDDWLVNWVPLVALSWSSSQHILATTNSTFQDKQYTNFELL